MRRTKTRWWIKELHHKESAVQMLAITYHIPNFEHEDRGTLVHLVNFYSQGKVQFYKKLIDEKRLVNTHLCL